MQCEKCQQNDACVHLTDVTNNTKREYHLCKDCADVHSVSIQAQLQKFKNINLPDFFTPLSDVSSEDKLQDTIADCPQCQMSYSLFRKDGKFGCAHDYTVFRSTLDDLLKKIHDSTQHRGRTPRRFRQQDSHQEDLDQLRQQLTSAVKGEQYEKAAAIRDQMRLMGNS